MTWLIRAAGALVVLAVLTAGVFYLLGERIWPALAGKSPVLAFETLAGPSAPNEFVVCPPTFCGREPDLVSPVYDVNPERLIELVSAAAPDGAIASAVSRDTMRYTTHSPIMRFPDYTDVRFLPAPDGGATLAIRAKALVGVDDFGVNEARVRAWLARLRQHERR